MLFNERFATAAGQLGSEIGARFICGEVNFSAEFCGSQVDFSQAGYVGGTVRFSDAEFSAGEEQFVRQRRHLTLPRQAWHHDAPREGPGTL